MSYYIIRTINCIYYLHTINVSLLLPNMDVFFKQYNEWQVYVSSVFFNKIQRTQFIFLHMKALLFKFRIPGNEM